MYLLLLYTGYIPPTPVHRLYTSYSWKPDTSLQDISLKTINEIMTSSGVLIKFPLSGKRSFDLHRPPTHNCAVRCAWRKHLFSAINNVMPCNYICIYYLLTHLCVFILLSYMLHLISGALSGESVQL